MNIARYEQTPRYSQMVIHGSTIYLSGQIADNWDADVTGQASEIFAKIDALLAKATICKASLVSLTVWLKTFDDYVAFNAAYDQWIDPANKPARATVRADLLDPRLRIEIMAIAAC